MEDNIIDILQSFQNDSKYTETQAVDDVLSLFNVKKFGGAILYEQFQESLKIVNEYKKQLEEHYKIVKKEIKGISRFANVTKETILYNTELSLRCINILRANEDELEIDVNWEMKLEELSKLSMRKFLQCRNAGAATLQELKELCFYADVKLLP